MAIETLRAEFPVLARLSYLNAGTDGPVPLAAAEAAREQIRVELVDGRAGHHHFARVQAIATDLRTRVATLIGCAPDAIALTRSTTDGVSTVLSALPLGPGDEVLTSDQEHPGLLAPLEAARRRKGFRVRVAPFDVVADEVRAATKLVACSHVSWINGRVQHVTALAAADALVLLDGAQGLGAVRVAVGELGCDFYAASGQKWLCGPDGSGYLFARAELAETLDPPWPGYASLQDPHAPAELRVHPGARRFDMGVGPGPATAWARAAFDVLAAAGWERVTTSATDSAARLADRLLERGLEVAPRGDSTLVSWHADDAEATVNRLAAVGIVVRHLPGLGLVRASVGAWTSDEEIERLAEAA